MSRRILPIRRRLKFFNPRTRALAQHIVKLQEEKALLERRLDAEERKLRGIISAGAFSDFQRPDKVRIAIDVDRRVGLLRPGTDVHRVAVNQIIEDFNRELSR